MKRLVFVSFLCVILAGTGMEGPLVADDPWPVDMIDQVCQKLMANLEKDEVNEFTAIIDMVFYLYTRLNRMTPQILRINDLASVTSSNFNKNRPTR
jgi:hypothetical protein